MRLFSPAQIVGYIAFFLGVTAFLQKNDRRLKFFNASESLLYALHFVLLGNLPASSSSLISSMRSFLAMKYRSLFLAAALVAANLTAGVVFAKSPAGWLPVVGACIATVAIFTLAGISLRCVLLFSTLLWLVNNIISGSIGGTLLEVVIATVNTRTIASMAWASRAAGPARARLAQPAPPYKEAGAVQEQ
jgi:hypothetical protein